MSDLVSNRKPAGILLLEDDLLLAMDMEDYLNHSGHHVVGPFARIADAMKAIPENELDGAIVDLNLRGELSFPVIELLQQRSVPLIVCSGYAELPELRSRLGDLPLLPKPWNGEKLTALMKKTFRIESRA